MLQVSVLKQLSEEGAGERKAKIAERAECLVKESEEFMDAVE